MLLAGRDPPILLSRRIMYLFVPVPWAAQLDDARSTGFYPGLVTNYLRATSQEYFDPIADFVNAQLKLSIETKDQAPGSSPLFNGRIGDGHFSARAQSSGRRPSGTGSPFFLSWKGRLKKHRNVSTKRRALVDAKAASER